jgi:ankyrin repeat protein
VELYVLARGVNLSARDAEGRSALEIAQRAGNRQLAAILSAAGAR